MFVHSEESIYSVGSKVPLNLYAFNVEVLNEVPHILFVQKVRSNKKLLDLK